MDQTCVEANHQFLTVPLNLNLDSPMPKRMEPRACPVSPRLIRSSMRERSGEASPRPGSAFHPASSVILLASDYHVVQSNQCLMF
ncbi:hypothetical protein LZ30DRAFT_265381 [Colletotrichum cereale]|nr:hypothetical protein LZ30DRAFT_265381 [Colletotrichum cereale]